METKKMKVVVLMLVAVGLMAGIAQANLLVNPGFEEGAFAAKVMPDGWSMSWLSYTSGWTWLSGAGAHSGSKYLKLNAWVTGTDTDPYQNIPATEDLVYAFSVWAKAAPGKTADAAVIIYWYDNADVQIGDTIHPTHTTVGDEWTYVEWTLTSPAGTAEARFRLEGLFANGFWTEPGGDPNPDGGGIYYDDARMLGSSPDVDAGPDMITWKGQTVSLTGSTSLVGSITWSANPAAGAAIVDGDTLTPDVTLTPEVSPFTYTLKLDIDGNYDTMRIDVYEDACQMARLGEGKAGDNPGDIDANCITDFRDFALAAPLWLTDKKLTAPIPNPIQAEPVTLVPNGSFEEVYKPGSTTITADLGGNWTNGVGDTPEDTAPMEAGQTAAYSDGTTGTEVYVPGWINTPGWPVNYEWPEGCGSIAGQTTPSDGVYYYTANGGDWGNPQGGTIVSDAPLGYAQSGTYTLSMVVNGPCLPIVLDLLADGEALTPSSIDDPGTYTWSTVTKTYDASSLAGHIGEALTIQIGVGSNATGTQSHFDSVALDFVSGDPTPPDVDAGPDMITISGLKVELDPNVVNNSNPVTALTYLWTANPATGVVFDPSADVEDPNVTITTPALITTAIAIVNPGFETPVLADGDYTLDFTNCPGWSNIDVNTAGGVWNPGLPGTAFPGYGGNAPEGQNVAYVNKSGIKQVLTKTFAVDTTYTLTVKVGNTDGFPWTGYKVQLLAGETVLAEDDNTVAIATGTFKTSTVTYTYDSGDSALLGQALQIRLFCLGSGGETDFDDVKLTAVGPVPVPYIVTLKLAVNNEGKPAVTDAMKIDVYDDACEAAITAGLTTELDPGNFDGNCIKDFRDIAVLVSTWLVDYTSTGPIPKP